MLARGHISNGCLSTNVPSVILRLLVKELNGPWIGIAQEDCKELLDDPDDYKIFILVPRNIRHLGIVSRKTPLFRHEVFQRLENQISFLHSNILDVEETGIRDPYDWR